MLAASGCDQPTLVPAASKIAYGTKIDFGQNGNSTAIKTSGWNTAEEKFTWSEGPSAVLTVDIVPTDRLVTLTMKMNGLFKEPELPTQPVEVYVNETKVADWQVGDIAVFSAPVPQNFTTAGGTLTFTFKIPKATSPQVLGKGADPRILGICVFEFELSTP